MRTFNLLDTPKFTVVSIGNGTFYQFINKIEKMEVFFQGDDALTFINEYKSGRDLYALWYEYSDAARDLNT